MGRRLSPVPALVQHPDRAGPALGLQHKGAGLLGPVSRCQHGLHLPKPGADLAVHIVSAGRPRDFGHLQLLLPRKAGSLKVLRYPHQIVDVPVKHFFLQTRQVPLPLRHTVDLSQVFLQPLCRRSPVPVLHGHRQRGHLKGIRPLLSQGELDNNSYSHKDSHIQEQHVELTERQLDKSSKYCHTVPSSLRRRPGGCRGCSCLPGSPYPPAVCHSPRTPPGSRRRRSALPQG